MTSKWNDPTRSLDISTKMTITRRPHSMPKFWAWLMGLQNVQPNDANTKKVGGFTLSSPSNRKASISENKAETRPTFRTNPSHRTIITFKTWNTSHLHPLWELPCSISKHIDWTLGLECPIRFDLDHDLDLGFSRSYMDFAIFHPKMVQLPQIENQAYWLNSWP